MNFEMLNGYPDLKQEVEDCHELQEKDSEWMVRNYPNDPGVTHENLAIEVLYHLLVHLLSSGDADLAENAVIRLDDDLRERMRRTASIIENDGLDAVPDLAEARRSVMAMRVLSSPVADDISINLRKRLQGVPEESLPIHLHNEAMAAAARLHDMLGEGMLLCVYGMAQMRVRDDGLPIAS